MQGASRAFTAALACVLVVLSIGACGGGSGSSSGDYFKQVTKIGNDLATNLQNIQGKATTAKTQSAAMAVFQQLEGVLATARKSLGALKPPGNVTSEHAKALAALDNAVTALKADISSGNVSKASDDYSKFGQAANDAILNISVKSP